MSPSCHAHGPDGRCKSTAAIAEKLENPPAMRNIDSTLDPGTTQKSRQRRDLDSKVAHHRPIFDF
jgi:hypothetical protein